MAVAALLAATATATAQLDVFRTFDDLVNKTPRSYPKAEFKRWSGKENTKLVFKDPGHEDIEIECEGIWGFFYGGGLFRITRDSKYLEGKGASQIGTPFVVTHLSEVVLYEYGLNVLDAMTKDRDQAYLQGMCGAMSADLNGPMAMVPCYAAKWSDERLLEFLTDNEDLADLKTVFVERRGKHKGYGGVGYFDLEWVRSMLRQRENERKEKQEEK